VEQWLWAFASRSNGLDHPPDPKDRLDPRARIRLSADWTGLALRDGMALLGTRPDRGGSDPFYNHAELYTRSIYLDAVLLGLLQLHGITDLEDTLAAAFDTVRPETDMARLEQRMIAFRHRLWWQHLGSHGTPNQIITALHHQHRLPERFEQILAEINDFNRLTEDDQSRHIGNYIILFTLLTAPTGLGLALLQALGHTSPLTFAAVLAATSFLTGILLATRPARAVIRAARRHLPIATPDTAKRKRRL
jgi:hypothetical protein